MMKSLFTVAAFGAAAFAAAQFNNDVLHTRFFNDAPGSNLVVTNNFPNTVEFNESNLYNSGGFANRHIWNFSSDGTTDASFGKTNYWDVKFNITLNATQPNGETLDKEAGFILQNSTQGGQGDSQFIVKSDGEVAMFGGSFTFHQFYKPNVAGDYQLGTTGTMELKYFAVNGVTMLTASFTYNNMTTSFTDATTMYPGTHIGGYGQYQITHTAGVGNTGDAIFGNISGQPVPEPASILALAIGGGILLRRRKKI